MVKFFKYNVITLIKLIESKPCLWDKTMDCFKDKIEKQNAWREIYMYLEEEFFKKDKKEQHRIGKLIIGKWQNIRDSFVKSLKRKSSHNMRRKYLYYDYLQFLLKVTNKDDVYPEVEDSQTEDTEDEQTNTKMIIQRDVGCDTTNNQSYGSQRNTRIQDSFDKEVHKVTYDEKTSPDEDEAFFMSVIPSVRKMSEEDKLEFRINVLQLIKNINKRVNNQSTVFPTSSSTLTPIFN